MSRLRTFLDSLKFRLTLGAMAALAVGMGIVALLLVQQAEHDTLDAQRVRQIGETVRTSQVLARRVVDLQRALQATATQFEPSMLLDRERLAEFVRTKPVLNAIFASVFVASSDGKLLLLQQGNERSEPNTPLGDRAYINQTLVERRPVSSEPVISRVSGEAIICVLTPGLPGPVTTNMLGKPATITPR